MNHIYYTITEVFDFGPHISRVILDADKDLAQAALAPEQFTVDVKRTAVQGEDFVWPVFMGMKPDDSMKGQRKVTNVYVSDRKGNPDADGRYITLELYCDPRIGLGSVIRFDGHFNVFVNVAYTITWKKPCAADAEAAGSTVSCPEISDSEPCSSEISNLKPGAPEDSDTVIFDQNGGNRMIYGEWLQTDMFQHPDGPLSYVYYDPYAWGAKASIAEQIPLIIWLHGAGEGGQEPLIAATGNKVVNLISPEIQKLFGGKTYLLAPQCPTMWMDDGSGEYTLSGKSRYVETLEELIASFINEHPQIDRSRIYLGGDSNGGFMTMKMLLRNPDRYAAAFPVCEALYDETISGEDLAVLAKLPIWFVHSKNDPVVDPEKYALATYRRLIAAGAPDVHITYYDRIVDETGLYKDENGEPFEYIGHWAWIPMLNDSCRTDYDGSPVLVDGKPVTLLQWAASHRKAFGR